MFVKKAVLLLLQVGSPIWRAAESLDFGHNDDSVLCRVLLIETLSEDFSSQIETACVPIIDNEEIDTSIVMGNIPTVHDYVRITKAVYQEKSLLTSNQSQVIPVQPASHFRRLRNQDPSSILMVRISTRDQEPTFTTKELEEVMTNPNAQNQTNFIQQFFRCSMGQVRFTPTKIMDVHIHQRVSSFESSQQLVDAAQEDGLFGTQYDRFG